TLRVPRGQRSSQEYQPASPRDESGELLRLAGCEAQVASREDHPAARERKGRGIGDYLDLEVMTPLERTQQRARQVRVIAGATGYEGLHEQSTRHLVDPTRRSGEGCRGSRRPHPPR